ncbi:MAG: type II secretion system protein GspG [Planctomycetota bacterium]
MCWSDKPTTLTDPAGYLFGPSEPPERGRKIGWDDPFDENLLSDLPVDKLRVIDLTVGESYLMPGPRESWVVLRITGHAKRGTPLAAGSLLVSFEWKWARKPRALRGSEIARKQVHDLVFTLGQYRQDYEGVYPDKLGQLMAPPDPDYKIYVTEKEALRDPWGRDFLYTVDNERMRLGTYGADGAPGGEDEDRDYFAEVPR